MLKSLQLSLLTIIISTTTFSQITPDFVSLRPRYTTSLTFNYTGSIQSWTVPAGVSTIFVQVYGAAGGDANTNLGGKGGKVTCNVPVTAGQVIYITVGGKSTTRTPLYGFGGTGGFSSANASNTSRAGGGLSGISFAAPITQLNARVIAAGGGGASFGYSPNSIGGNGGGLLGANGVSGFGQNCNGKGATQVAGGVAGSPYDGNTTQPTGGIAISGGNGGVVNNGGWNGGAGGGAGYFGGGGGAGGGAAQGGGGGGSSWTHSSCSSITHTAGFNSGHGYVVITY